MTEDREAPRLQPADIAALLEALREGAPRTPPGVPRASDVLIGDDARVLQALIDARTSVFLTREQIRDLARDLIHEENGKIGLRMDESHIEATGDAIRSAMKWHKRLDKVIGGIALAILTSAIYAVANLLGIKLPMPTGGG